MKKPELMCPVGGWSQLYAAIEAGADAVYFGLDCFSARSKVGFSTNELPKIFDLLHRHDVKGYVTLNTLVFDNELPVAERSVQAIADSGADAVIVQDIGLAVLIARIAPLLEIHGSTQMSITSAEGVEFAAGLGCLRVVLGRELSLSDIRKVTECVSICTEVFVHGALCVSYSGQCFSSEAWGGRSANRGQCAQACRLSYELVVDDEAFNTGPNRYPLSPGDLFALDHIPELISAGVSCFKIEGRYKDEHYVAATTRAYRKAIDAAWEHKTLEQRDELGLELEQIYSRGLGPFFLEGTNHQKVVQGRVPRHRGVHVGTVELVRKDAVVITLHHEISPGDGLVFDAADWRSPDLPEEGGNVYAIERLGNTSAKLSFANGQIDFRRIRVGDLVWRTSAPKLVQLLNPLAQPTELTRKSNMDISVTCRIGEPLQVTARIHSNVLDKVLEITKCSAHPVQPASNRALSLELLRQHLGRLGGTPFLLGQLECNSEGPAFLPVSELNELRREIVAEALQMRRRPAIPVKTKVIDEWMQNQSIHIAQCAAGANRTKVTARLDLLVRNPEQLDAALEVQPDSITLDYLELYGLRNSVLRVSQAGIRVRVASPRILKPAEQKVVHFLRSLECDILVRSSGLLHQLLQLPEHSRPLLIGDFSLNVANVVSAQTLLDQGLDFVTPSYDLNGRQIEKLARGIDVNRLETIVFSHLPVFHTEHCVFCRFLSRGTDSSNCGHPCESRRLSLQDHNGRQHPVLADVGCRNTVFGHEAQFSAQYLKRWIAVGISNFRVEFVHQTAADVIEISRSMKHAIKGHAMDGLDAKVRQIMRDAVTSGSLYVPRGKS
ncbi:MAG TPA: DUF3656 domain-containing protein [Pirellulaceae bacterium]|nr:DUF3656 domain-containing protein [Pirellulaceae bacterium]HMO94228.1 DUF3656 domain-containing protein [Pirellulaceae bacterium]HMP71264.1 DUF3656 domain-containing protein [Pirellulaceae bacterium]